jgi:hypothetical protein
MIAQGNPAAKAHPSTFTSSYRDGVADRDEELKAKEIESKKKNETTTEDFALNP